VFRHFNIFKSRLSRGFVPPFDFLFFEENFMSEDEEKYFGFFLNELMHGNPILRFGTLLRAICEAAGLTQPLLEKYGQAEYAQLEKSGFITPDDPVTSMLQEVISRVLRGKQRPSYTQTYIWITVVKRHYSDPRIKKIFKDKKLEMPKFTPEIEDALWTLAGYSSPQDVIKVSYAFKDFSSIPRRLPAGTEIIPQTEPLQIIHRDTKDLAKIKEPELQH
jgi:transcriptional regulator with XRE-family HTH domain